MRKFEKSIALILVVISLVTIFSGTVFAKPKRGKKLGYSTIAEEPTVEVEVPGYTNRYMSLLILKEINNIREENGLEPLLYKDYSSQTDQRAMEHVFRPFSENKYSNYDNPGIRVPSGRISGWGHISLWNNQILLGDMSIEDIVDLIIEGLENDAVILTNNCKYASISVFRVDVPAYLSEMSSLNVSLWIYTRSQGGETEAISVEEALEEFEDGTDGWETVALTTPVPFDIFKNDCTFVYPNLDDKKLEILFDVLYKEGDQPESLRSGVPFFAKGMEFKSDDTDIVTIDEEGTYEVLADGEVEISFWNPKNEEVLRTEQFIAKDGNLEVGEDGIEVYGEIEKAEKDIETYILYFKALDLTNNKQIVKTIEIVDKKKNEIESLAEMLESYEIEEEEGISIPDMLELGEIQVAFSLANVIENNFEDNAINIKRDSIEEILTRNKGRSNFDIKQVLSSLEEIEGDTLEVAISEGDATNYYSVPLDSEEAVGFAHIIYDLLNLLVK